jgi:hypothetical protein
MAGQRGKKDFLYLPVSSLIVRRKRLNRPVPNSAGQFDVAFSHVTSVCLDKITDLLVPLFLPGTVGHLAAARHTARTMLASYDVESEDEIRLAAEIASFGFGALEALSKSMAPELSQNAVLRLRGCALHRSGHQCQRALDRL